MNIISSNTSTLDIPIEDQVILKECQTNILKNINRAIDRQKEPPNRISELLAMRWYIQNDIVETN